jgi:hypothetical protein
MKRGLVTVDTLLGPSPIRLQNGQPRSPLTLIGRPVECRGFESHLGQLFCPWKVRAVLGVVDLFALPCLLPRM